METVDLLNSIYKTADLGRDVTRTLMTRCNDEGVRSALMHSFAQYSMMLSDAKRQLCCFGADAHNKKAFHRKAVFAGIRFNLALDPTPSHIAEMLIQGNTMGLIETAGALNKAKHALPSARALATRLIAFFEGSSKELLELL